LFLQFNILSLFLGLSGISLLILNVRFHGRPDIFILLLFVEFLHQIGRSDFLEEESIDMLLSENVLLVDFEVFFLLLQPKLLSEFPNVLDNHVNDVRNEGQADEDH
jgi:hypothetical protein